MLVRTSFANDARVQKESASLSRLGWSVKVVALWEPGLARRETLGGVEVVRPRSRLMFSLFSKQRRGGKRGAVAGTHPAKRRQLSPARRWLNAASSALDGALFGLQALAEIVRRGRPSVIHAHDLNVLPAGFILSRLARAKLVYDSHEIHCFSISIQSRPALWRRACRHVERFCIRRADAAITVNESCAKAIARLHGVPRPAVLYNSPALADRGARPPRGLRETVGAAASAPIAIYAGSLTINRGIEQAIRALALAPGIRLALLGYGEPVYLASLRGLAAELGVAERVLFVPAVAPREVSGAMREADASLVLIQDAGLSYRYSTPNKLFESLHAGIPIIGADLPEIRRALRRFDCGLTVRAEEPESIARAMQRLLSDRALQARLAAGAQRAALELNWESEEAKLARTYASIGATPPAPPRPA
jgi:glycosyltransferase involved in cell wall biosynthesis